MLRPLDEWDWEYVDKEIATPTESAAIEKKASEKFTLKTDGSVTSDTEEEIAKQVCAFANAEGGFLVFGITKDGRLDNGVPRVVGRGGRTTTTDWVEAIIPKLVRRPLSGCQARLIAKPDFHASDRGTLVVSIPFSAQRPHWIKQGDKDVAYIRLGAHSGPMSLQTFLDIHSRTDAQQGEIVTWGKSEKRIRHDLQREYCTIRPKVRLKRGPIAERWGLELRVSHKTGTFGLVRNEKVIISEGSHVVFFEGRERLFPGRATVAGACTFTLFTTSEAFETEIHATLYIESAPPQTFKIPAKEFHALENEQSDI